MRRSPHCRWWYIRPSRSSREVPTGSSSSQKVGMMGLATWFQLISLWTKWLLFRRRYLQMHFMNENFCILVKISLKFFLRVQLIITQHNDLAPKRRQVIIWTYADLVHWRIYAALDELTYYHRNIWLWFKCVIIKIISISSAIAFR